MSGSATLTMNRSRLASTTPAQTITSTIVGEASPRRAGSLLIRDTFLAPGRDVLGLMARPAGLGTLSRSWLSCAMVSTLPHWLSDTRSQLYCDACPTRWS